MVVHLNDILLLAIAMRSSSHAHPGAVDSLGLPHELVPTADGEGSIWSGITGQVAATIVACLVNFPAWYFQRLTHFAR